MVFLSHEYTNKFIKQLDHQFLFIKNKQLREWISKSVFLHKTKAQ